MAKKKKRTHHRRKHRRSRGLLGSLGAASGAAERLIGAIIGGLVTEWVLCQMDDERLGPVLALGAGGFVALNYTEGFINGMGIGAMVVGGLKLGCRHLPWMRGVTVTGTDSNQMLEDNVRQIRLGMMETVTGTPNVRVGGMAGWVGKGGSW